MGSKPSVPQNTSVIAMPIKLTYETKVQRIAQIHGWIQYATHLDSFCSFYYDPKTKHVWIVQKIGNEEVLITKPSDEYVLIISKKYPELDIVYASQPGVFYGF